MDFKYEIGTEVIINGWTESVAEGIIIDRCSVWHHRSYEHVPAYSIKFKEGHKNPLTLNPIPEGYIKIKL
jgi:hypothetical protein